MADLNWSDAQWQKVNDCVTEAFGKTSVASAFLPLYGPLPGGTETVRNERLRETDRTKKPPTVTLDADHDSVNLKLVNLTVNVELSGEQVAEDSLSNAMLAFRRAANILAQEEDGIVFDGLRRGPEANDLFVANTVEPQRGLADLIVRLNQDNFEDLPGGSVGSDIVFRVVRAIGRLEKKSNSSPFFCVLGDDLFDKAHDPSPNLVLPADRIAPLLRGGSLLRSGKMDSNTGIVVSLSAGAVDIVVGTPPTVQFLQRTDKGRFLFRVYERFALRVRDTENLPVAGFTNQSAITVQQYQKLEALAAERAVKLNNELQRARDNVQLAQMKGSW
jgi:uncharacterized linocin/CFP29 family protein